LSRFRRCWRGAWSNSVLFRGPNVPPRSVPISEGRAPLSTRCSAVLWICAASKRARLRDTRSLPPPITRAPCRLGIFLQRRALPGGHALSWFRTVLECQLCAPLAQPSDPPPLKPAYPKIRCSAGRQKLTSELVPLWSAENESVCRRGGECHGHGGVNDRRSAHVPQGSDGGTRNCLAHPAWGSLRADY
jgi:hypothetical protein